MLVTLSKGQTAELRAPEDVSERLRRPISRVLRNIRPEVMEALQNATTDDMTDEERNRAAAKAVQEVGMTDEEVDALSTANDYAIVALVAKWSYGVPITLDAILDLPGRDYSRLREVVAPLINAMFVDVSPDPNPPAPSGGSNGLSLVSAEDQSTIPLSTGGHTA